jgi:ABC-type nitrate/sulfonate/bicarbonate transport system ATPase subunit
MRERPVDLAVSHYMPREHGTHRDFIEPWARAVETQAAAAIPDMLLLDEPLSALEKKLRAELQWELKQVHQRVGTTFVYVTHDQEEALSMSDEIAMIREIVVALRPEKLEIRSAARPGDGDNEIAGEI